MHIYINNILYNLLTLLLIGAGVIFTWRFRFIQFRTLRHSISMLWKPTHKKGITPFQAFSVGIASRVGTGTITGVAVALTTGGPGAIFWMWITALVGMSSAFVEATLAQIFKVSNHDHTFRGGPAYYIRIGLNSRFFSTLFAIALLISFGFVFNAVQANSIAEAFQTAFHWSPMSTGILLLVCTAPVLFGGIKRISQFSQMAVPLMAIGYLVLVSIIIIQNIGVLPTVICVIFKSAFGFTQAIGGIAGYTIHQAMVVGIKRGLFANEAGMGSAPNAAAAATTTHPVTQGLLQMLGVAIDTLVICTATAFMILVSGQYVEGLSIEGAALTQRAIASGVGDWGGSFMALAIFFFAWTTIIGNYAYAEINLQFFSKKRFLLYGFRLAVLSVVLVGALSSLPTVWDIADTSMAVMATINLVAIMLLCPYALSAWQDYRSQILAGKLTPSFSLSALPKHLARRVLKSVWPSK